MDSQAIDHLSFDKAMRSFLVQRNMYQSLSSYALSFSSLGLSEHFTQLLEMQDDVDDENEANN